MFDTKTFLLMTAFLLVVGTLASVMGGGVFPAAPSLSLIIPGGAVTCGGSCVPNAWSLYLNCMAEGLWCFAIGVVAFITAIFISLVNLAIYLGTLMLFFTGLVSLFGFGGGSVISIPQPFGTIAAILVMFAWILIVIEFIGRAKAMVFPR
jgi:energy-converting hydrogenase Eha subunit E